MHKQVILLTRAKTRQEARSNAEIFLASYIYSENNFFDEYIIGGRFSGKLNPITEDFEKKAFDFIKNICFNKYLPSFVPIQSKRDNYDGLQKIWEEMGGKDINPWNRDNFGKEEYEDDILPLFDCKDFFLGLGPSTPQIDDFGIETDIYDMSQGTSNISTALNNEKEYYAVNVDICF